MSIDIRGVSPQEIQLALSKVGSLPKSEQIELHKMLEKLEELQKIEKSQTTFLFQ